MRGARPGSSKSYAKHRDIAPGSPVGARKALLPVRTRSLFSRSLVAAAGLLYRVGVGPASASLSVVAIDQDRLLSNLIKNL